MQQIEPFTYGNYYHVYNHGINECNLFKENANYEYFLKLYENYISPVADTFAWVMMPNHFHFLLRVKEKQEIDDVNPDRVPNPVRVLNHVKVSNPVRLAEAAKVGTPSQQMSKLFNSYAQAFNKRYSRHGALFERPFKRKVIKDDSYLKNVILYIHNNPVHHGFCEHAMAYPWSSYLSCISVKPTKLHRHQVIGWFDDLANFKYMHNCNIDFDGIDKWLDLK